MTQNDWPQIWWVGILVTNLEVTTAVYHLGLDANSTGWILLETAHKGIHYPELPQQECEMRCITSKIQALDTKVREVQLVKSIRCLWNFKVLWKQFQIVFLSTNPATYWNQCNINELNCHINQRYRMLMDLPSTPWPESSFLEKLS